MTKYAIKLVTYAPDTTPEAVISSALGFNNTLSHGAIIDLFVNHSNHKSGVFKRKKSATIAAERINGRGSFGGFGKFAVIAEVVEV